MPARISLLNTGLVALTNASAAVALRPAIGDVSQIKSLDIFSFDAAVDIIGKDPEKWRPKTRETADHSLPYCTAVALTDGDVTLDSFSDERLRDESLLDLIAKIKIHRDAKLTARYPRGIPNRLEVALVDGRRLVAENTLSAADFIWPIFIIEGAGKRVPVPSMPNVRGGLKLA
jgi:2-methylcitrate dehydratase PrpD